MLIPGNMNYFTSHGLNLGCRKLKFRPMNIVNSTKYNNFRFPKLQLKVSWYLYNYESSNRTLFLIPFVFFKAELLPLPPKILLKIVFYNKWTNLWIMKRIYFILVCFFWAIKYIAFCKWNSDHFPQSVLVLKLKFHFVTYLWLKFILKKHEIVFYDFFSTSSSKARTFKN